MAKMSYSAFPGEVTVLTPDRYTPGPIRTPATPLLDPPDEEEDDDDQEEEEEEEDDD